MGLETIKTPSCQQNLLSELDKRICCIIIAMKKVLLAVVLTGLVCFTSVFAKESTAANALGEVSGVSPLVIIAGGIGMLLMGQRMRRHSS
ncbi:MAG: hypothetical protein WCO68_01050 [Verrucomicrobiota bacterium]